MKSNDACFFSSDEESSQVFIPFVSDVRVGNSDSFVVAGPSSVDLDDSLNQSGGLVSPPADSKLTPPSSPHIGHHAFDLSNSPQQPGSKER